MRLALDPFYGFTEYYLAAMDNPYSIWEDYFFNPERYDTSSETVQRMYRRYVSGAKAVVDSYSVPVGLTPKDEIWALNKARLYRYHPVVPEFERHPLPLLLVYALINKPFIFDLVPGRSFVEYMLERGFDIYLLDWGSPGIEDKNILFDDYVTEYLTRAVRKMLRVSRASEFSMLGYCIGATLATVYAAIYPQAPLRNLILLTAPLDFTNKPPGSLSVWLDENVMDVDKLVDTMGNVPGEMIELWAKMLKPMENFFGVYVNLMKMLDDQMAVWAWQAINRWVEDVVPFAGEAFRQYVHVYLRGNKLVRGEHQIAGQVVDLVNIDASLLNIVAQHDHLVSPSQSETIMDLVSSTDKEMQVLPSTHVGIMISRGAKHKLWPEVANWLAERSTID